MRHRDCTCKYPHATKQGCARQKHLAKNIEHTYEETIRLRSAEEIATERAAKTPDEASKPFDGDEDTTWHSVKDPRTVHDEPRTPYVTDDEGTTWFSAPAAETIDVPEPTPEPKAKSEDFAERILRSLEDEHAPEVRRRRPRRETAPAHLPVASLVDPQLFVAAVREAAEHFNTTVRIAHEHGLAIELRATMEGGLSFFGSDDNCYIQISAKVRKEL
jgi:hypothetical protein